MCRLTKGLSGLCGNLWYTPLQIKSSGKTWSLQVDLQCIEA